jgi:predicted ATPase
MAYLTEQYLRSVALKRDKVPSFKEYPFSIPGIRNLETIEFHPKVTFLIGDNGTGKSTLLEAIAIACGLNPEGGSRNMGFATRESHSPLHQFLRVVRGVRRPKDSFFLRAESFYNVATQIDDLEAAHNYGGISLHAQSHGESFWALLTNRFWGNGLYFLDEPEAALSPTRQLAALALLHQLTKKSSQFVIATHSPIIMAYPEADILLISQDGISSVHYEDTEHYRVARDFMNRRENILKELLQDDTGTKSEEPI